MPASPFTPQLRPLSIGEVLDAGFRLLRARFGTLVVCTLVPVVPLTAISMLVVASTDPAAFDVNATTTTADSGTVALGNLLDRIITGAAAALAIGACFKTVSSAYLGERVTAGESLRYGLGRLLPLMVAYLVLSIAVTIGLIALVIPGIFLAIRWSMTFPAIVGERAGAFAGMGRSWALTKGHWWRTFGTLIVVILMTFVLMFVFIAAAGAIAAAVDSIGETGFAVLMGVSMILVLAVAYPLVAAIVTVYYYDLRVRDEGFDLQRLARGVGSDESRFESAPERPDPLQPTGGGFTPSS